MPKYNIYRLQPQKKDECISKLKLSGLIPQIEQKLDGYSMQLYFSQEPDEKEIPWLKLYENFIDNNEDLRNKTYFAVLLISKGKNILYAVSLGKSHFYLQEFCDLDFGINIGLRILDKTSVNNKNSRLFGGKKKKNLTIYQTNTEIDIESGESVVYLKGRTIDKEKWGKNLICGSSALFSIKDFQPNSIPSLITKIEQKLKEEPLFNIPRAEAIIKQDEIKILDQKLITTLKNKIDTVDIDEQTLSGVEFIFSKDYHFSLKAGDSSWLELEDQSIPTILGLLAENNFEFNSDTIDKVKIKATPDEGTSFTKNIRCFLDYVDNEYYFLNNGKWFKFNQKYVEYLHSEVDKIEWKTFTQFTYSASEFTDFLNTIDEKEKKKWYAEKFFNEKQAVKHNYINLDRDLNLFNGYKLEVADLYKDNTLYFVKIGNLQKQNYVIQQCAGSLKLLFTKKNKVRINGKEQEIETICLWLILNRKQEISNLKNLKSFLFLMGLVDCFKECRMAGLKLTIRISYKK